MKAIFTCLVSFLFYFSIFSAKNVYAFFTENYKKNMSYGAFKQIYNTDGYLGINVGFMAKSWISNIATSILADKDVVAEYSRAIPEQMFQKTSDNYSYYIGIFFGLYNHGSRFRHEFEFAWYGLTTAGIGLTGNTIGINGTNYEYANISNNMVISAGVYTNIYKLTYNAYVNFNNVFSFLGSKWDIFFGAGAGFAVVSGGIFAGEKINNKNNAQYEYVNNKISTTTKVKDNSLFSSTGLAVVYQGKFGFIANISQSFATSISVVFGATSRPLLTTRFNYIDRIDGASSHLEYHIATEVGTFLKALEISL